MSVPTPLGPDRVSRMVRRAMLGAGLGAIVALGIGLMLGAPGAGVAAALGLLLGSANALLVQRSASLGMAFTALSLGRLVLLSAVGLVIGFLLVPHWVFLLLGGMALAQLILVGLAAKEALTS